MRRQYKYTPLTNAKLVGRRHSRDIPLPGLKELENAFVSRSDNAITMRPDFNKTSEDLLAVSASFSASDPAPADYLNSVSGIYGTDDLLWWSRMAPLSWDGTTSATACSTYATGTISAASDQKVITGSGTDWKQKVWVGCWIEMDEDGKYYKIDSITSATELSVSEDLEDSYSGDSYTIYRTHQADHADYKLNLQPFTSGMIYSCPTITMPVDANKICGPFYASVVETSTEDAWVNFTDDTDVGIVDSSISGQLIASGGVNWMALVGKDSSDDWIVMYSTAPGDDWAVVSGSVGGGFDFTGNVAYGDGRFWSTGS